MKESLRYKICLWMVWVQLALIPTVYLMMWVVDGTPYIWRWNLLSWAIFTGYLIGFIALPLSRGLDKPKLLKWWLRIDFVATILLFIPFYFTFMASKANFVSERGKYILFTTGGGMAIPALRLGKSDGLFIKELYNSDAAAFDINAVDWFVNEDYGYSSLKTTYDTYKSIHVFPIDSSAYHQHNNVIDTQIDSIFHANLIGYDKMEFVMPKDFSTIEYRDSSSIEYHRSDYIQLAEIEYRSFGKGNLLDSVLITLSISKNDILSITDSDTLLVERVETERWIYFQRKFVIIICLFRYHIKFFCRFVD